MSYFRWGDTLTVEQGHFTLTAGIDPSIATLKLQIPDGATVDREATLYFSDGTNQYEFPGCRAIEGSLSHDAGDRYWTLLVRDRRWQWRKTGDISGEYNRRDESGTIIDQVNALTARQLAELCLLALGETGYNVNGLSPLHYPYVNWDHENPAEALAELCYRYSAVITLTTANKVWIYQKGTGQEIPSWLNREEYHPHIALVDKPEFTAFVGGRNLYQCEVALTACGLDTDGVICPLADLSYAPGDGNWDSVLHDETLTAAERYLVNGTVFRYYLLPDQITIGETVYERAEASRRWHSELVDKAQQDGEYKRGVAYVTGAHRTAANLDDYLNVAEDADDRVDVPFEFYPRWGLIIFQDPVFQASESKLTGASLTLTCCFEGETYYLEFQNPGGLAGRREHLRREDVFYEYKYDAGAFVLQNGVDADARAQAYATEALLKYDYFTSGGVQTTVTNVYAGFQNFFPDGGIQQVTWEISSTGENPPLTTVSWGCDHDFPAGTPEHAAWMDQLVRTLRARREKLYADSQATAGYKES